MIYNAAGFTLPVLEGVNADTPVIGWRNLVTSANVAASSADASYPATNLANPSTALRWRAASGTPPSEITLTSTFAAATDTDYVGIARHNLASVGGTVRVEGRPGTSPNLLSYSEQIDNAAWAKTRSTVTANAAAAPDGATTADKLIEDSTATNTHFVSAAPALADNTVHCFSVHAKAAELTRLVVAIITKAGVQRGIMFDLSAGTAAVMSISGWTTPPTAYGIVATGGGWYRCWVAHDVGSGATLNIPRCYLVNASGQITYTGGGANGVLLWGAQMEAASAPTAYVGMAAGLTTFVPLVAATTMSDNTPSLFRFTKRSLAAVRLVIAGATTTPFCAVMYAGALLYLQRRIYVGHTPITLGRSTSVINARAESGEFLGRIVTGQTLESQIALQNLTPDWYRANLDPFVRGGAEAPFFWAWRPSSYPAETAYAWLTGQPKPQNQRTNGMMSVTLQIGGLAT